MSLNQEVENSPMAQWNQQADGKAAVPIRFTPTGKISHAKTRVYTQRYRKEWESLPDFQGWLTSIPYHPTRAYCLYCKKDLHAHRLSLLKHMCTMKHQRSALAKQCNGNLKPNIQYIDTDQDKEHYMQEEYLEDSDIQYFVEKLDMGEEGGVEYEARYEESFEEVEDDPSNVEYITTVNQKGSNRDALEVAMAHVQSEDMGQEEQEEMMVESNDSQDIIICEAAEEADKRENNEKGSFDENTVVIRKQSQTARKSMKRILVNPLSGITVTPTGRTITLQGNKSEPRTKYVVKNIKGNLQTLVVAPKKEDGPSETVHLVEENEQEPQENTASAEVAKIVRKDNSATKSGAPNRKSRISTHVIDTNKGTPISGLPVSIYKLVDGRWTFLNESSTMSNGYCTDLIDPEKSALTNGRYKLHFDVDKYFTNRDIETIYPFIEIAFDVKNPTAQYHMPILLSPFGYTTYRGCES